MSSQGAGSNGGQGAGKSFVSFSRGAAQRIAKVVRVVEAGDRSQDGLTFDHPMPSASRKVFRVATFSGVWDKNTSKTVTFRNQTSTPNTAMAENLFVTVGNTATGTLNCAIGRDGTAWYLIAAEC